MTFYHVQNKPQDMNCFGRVLNGRNGYFLAYVEADTSWGQGNLWLE